MGGAHGWQGQSAGGLGIKPDRHLPRYLPGVDGRFVPGALGSRGRAVQGRGDLCLNDARQLEANDRAEKEREHSPATTSSCAFHGMFLRNSEEKSDVPTLVV